MVKFRFQDLKIWQLAIEIADELEEKKLFRFADLDKLCRQITNFRKSIKNHMRKALCLNALRSAPGRVIDNKND